MTVRRVLLPMLLMAALFATEARPEPGVYLGFEERVAAERIILRAYLRHQEGMEGPEAALTEALLRERVIQYLEKSAALELFWATPVTRGMLLAEWKRIVDNTSSALMVSNHGHGHPRQSRVFRRFVCRRQRALRARPAVWRGDAASAESRGRRSLLVGSGVCRRSPDRR